eukprot:TRINITY_DN7187_c2_g3_i1.p1 TRINITY_DN7187_c2_g3~~TRINITY_DN7187_c2_g3_i1.p1  ORF type:complete len:465 (+),score=139.81 TRINITY_DN7187_c2_g3_i1:53-1396(+)
MSVFRRGAAGAQWALTVLKRDDHGPHNLGHAVAAAVVTAATAAAAGQPHASKLAAVSSVYAVDALLSDLVAIGVTLAAVSAASSGLDSSASVPALPFGSARAATLLDFVSAVALTFLAATACGVALERVLGTTDGVAVSDSGLTFVSTAVAAQAALSVFVARRERAHSGLAARLKTGRCALPACAILATVVLRSAARATKDDDGAALQWVQYADGVAAVAALAELLRRECAPRLLSQRDILLQRRPDALKASLDRARRQAASHDGVLEVAEERVWSLTKGVCHGSLRIRARSDAVESDVLRGVRKAYDGLLSGLVVQVEKDSRSKDLPPLAYGPLMAASLGESADGLAPPSSCDRALTPPAAAGDAAAPLLTSVTSPRRRLAGEVPRDMQFGLSVSSLASLPSEDRLPPPQLPPPPVPAPAHKGMVPPPPPDLPGFTLLPIDSDNTA